MFTGRREFFWKCLSVVFLSLCVITFFLGQVVKAETVKEVKIGNVLPLSGDIAPIGQVGKMAREMAVEEINAAGGIKSLGGAKLKMLYADSRGDPKIGATETEKLIVRDNVVVVTGCYQSTVTYAATAVAERYKVPFLVPVSVMDKITERGFKYTFRLAAKASWWARDQIRFIDAMGKKTGKKAKTLALIYENTDWGQSTAEGWRELAPKYGLKVVLDEPYPHAAPDLTPVVIKLKNSGADVALFVSYAADAILLTNTIAEMKVNCMAFIGSAGGHADPTYLKNTGENAHYWFDVAEWESDIDPQSQEIAKKFYERYELHMPAEAVDVYAAMYVLANALERAASTDPEKIRDALAKTYITTGPAMVVPYEVIEFDESGQNPHASLVIVQIREVGGKLERVSVWPAAAAREGYEPIWPIPGWEQR